MRSSNGSGGANLLRVSVWSTSWIEPKSVCGVVPLGIVSTSVITTGVFAGTVANSDGNGDTYGASSGTTVTRTGGSGVRLTNVIGTVDTVPMSADAVSFEGVQPTLTPTCIDDTDGRIVKIAANRTPMFFDDTAGSSHEL